MAYLKEYPTLRDLQNYIDKVCKERGWTKDNYFQIDLEKAFREKERVNQTRTWE